MIRLYSSKSLTADHKILDDPASDDDEPALNDPDANEGNDASDEDDAEVAGSRVDEDDADGDDQEDQEGDDEVADDSVETPSEDGQLSQEDHRTPRNPGRKTSLSPPEESPVSYGRTPQTLKRSQRNRYFVEPESPKFARCVFCRRTGHAVADCPKKESRCFLCDADHELLKCPLADVCFNCFRLGHQRKECHEYTSSRLCVYCNLRTHSTMECVELWRRYNVKKRKTRHNREAEVVKFCYNCGERGHFGDSCSRYTVANSSAFS
ncbi:hypothetical protein DFJ73DRAFT_811301 [Zopfochytrium polystomum]|nr:hypothetical protein DFJ73DRAFT_811301 [Zopfochytrium polystomum]